PTIDRLSAIFIVVSPPCQLLRITHDRFPRTISSMIALFMHPSATRSAPCRCISSSKSLPLSSIKVTAHSRTLTERPELVTSCQQASSSCTQGPASFPSSSKVVPVGLVRVVIFNMSFRGRRQFHVTQTEPELPRRKFRS